MAHSSRMGANDAHSEEGPLPQQLPTSPHTNRTTPPQLLPRNLSRDGHEPYLSPGMDAQKQTRRHVSEHTHRQPLSRKLYGENSPSSVGTPPGRYIPLVFPLPNAFCLCVFCGSRPRNLRNTFKMFNSS
eukprot:TRINITY_DN3118_c0_g1_i3.p1 TRINITY_DN3118_c0_g1~~TRINITY_DN3118_c0_g1_i3.p1  ORF type:complete len:129 (+),score=2.25 TRINITY_DN3118_c0_g1_i3:136-522(+)